MNEWTDPLRAVRLWQGWIDRQRKEHEGMQLKFKKFELLELLRDAADQQATQFDEKWQAWADKSREHFDEQLEDSKTGEHPSYPFAANMPRSHASDFRRVISAIEASSSDEVELTPAEFEKYVIGGNGDAEREF